MQQKNNLLSLSKLFNAAGIPGYLLFARNILSFVTSRQRDLEDYTGVDDSAMLQIIYVLVTFLISSFILLIDPSKRRLLFSSPQIFLFIYIIICLFSILWTPNIFITGYRAFESLTFLLLISLVVNNLNIRVGFQDIIEWCILWISWDILWSLARGAKLFGIEYILWPFNASRLAVPMLFFFALFLSQRNYFKYSILTFAILMVSNKVFFGIALGLLGFFYGNSKYKGWMFLIIISIMVALVFVDVDELLKNTLFYGRESVSMTNTSGRDKIWAIAWEAFLQKPFTGYGYVDGENMILYSKFKGGAINAHNFLFSGLLGTGIVGTLFLVLYFGNTFIKASNNYFPSNNWRPAMVSTFIMSLVVSLTAPGLGGRVYGSWIPVVLIFTIISALQYKFEVLNKVKNIQKLMNNENYMDHA